MIIFNYLNDKGAFMNIERIASLFLISKGIITTEKAIKVIKDLSLISEFKLFYYNILA